MRFGGLGAFLGDQRTDRWPRQTHVQFGDRGHVRPDGEPDDVVGRRSLTGERRGKGVGAVGRINRRRRVLDLHGAIPREAERPTGEADAGRRNSPLDGVNFTCRCKPIRRRIALSLNRFWIQGAVDENAWERA